MLTDNSVSDGQFVQLEEIDELASLISQIERENPETLRLLASGMLDYLECRLGGQCYCGKPSRRARDRR